MKLPAYVASSDSVHTVKYICTLREFLRLAMKVWTSPHSYTQMYLYIASIMFNVSNSHEGRTFFGGISIEEMAKDKDLQKEMLTRQQLIQQYYDTHWGDGSWETRRSYIAKIKLNFQQNYLPENRSNLKKDGKESNLAYHAKVLQMRKEDPPGRASQTAEIMMIRPRRRQPAPTATLLWVDRSTWLFLFWSQAVLESKQYKFGCSDPKCGKNMRIWVRPQDWTTPTGWFQDKEVQAVERRKRFSVYLRQAGQADREGLWTRTWLSQYLHLRCAGRLYQQLSADQERVIRGPFSQFWQTIIDGCDQIQNAVNIYR